ncbi:Protein IMPACT -like protein [Ceratocystis fimbriata CBS 114723]|uniref:Protein IMPACT-like protein n=1 Tax=Ceratocystis fimbriata CBS 114723 TaxID=1035309 RepID=A0A2C5XI34_9PEZI|nr:Protein IMPACT -like protein [Ceratocystis fimbriata CBS 114723]
MSEDFIDEIEAINSIYGDNTITPISGSSPASYILTLPTTKSSLRMTFPETYPETEPPIINGLHSAGDLTKRGSGARDVRLFQEALGTSYVPGAVCLFDALEELSRLLEDEAAAEKAAELEAAEGLYEEVGGEGEGQSKRHTQTEDIAADLTGPAPPWTLSMPFMENKSTFLARAARVDSPTLAAQYIAHLLASDKKVRSATHNITAWRIRGPTDGSGKPGAVYQDCDDDGETAAGGRLLHLMQIADVWDVVVVVTRWYGGLKLGPRRFALINNAGRDALVRGGFIEEKETSKKKR